MSENTKDYQGISPENLDSDISAESKKQAAPPANANNSKNNSTGPKKRITDNEIVIKMSFKDKFNTNVAKILLILGPSGVIKSECFCSYISKRLDTQLNLIGPWEKFLAAIEYNLKDNDEEKYTEMTGKLKNYLNTVYTDNFVSALAAKIDNSSDQNMRNMIAKEAFTKPLLDFFSCTEYELDTFVDPKSSTEEEGHSDAAPAFSTSSTYDSNEQLSFVTVIPVIDPVNGKRADTLSIGEKVFIQQHDSSMELNTEIADILPSNVDNRILLYVKIEDNVMGKLVVSENTLIKNTETMDDGPVDEDMIKFVVIAGIIAIILIGLMLYIL